MSDESPETTDKGRPRPAGSSQARSTTSSTQAAKKAPAAKKASVKSGPTKSGPAKSGPATSEPAKKTTSTTSSTATSTGASGRALTANDYAASTSNSASSTAVIPAVKDEPAAAPSKAAAAPAPAPAQNNQIGGGAGRAATLRLSHVDPWSVTRMAFAISVALMVVAVVAVAIFWLVLEALGIWDTVDNSVTSVLSDDTTAFSITDYLGFGRLVGLTLVLSALNVIIATVLATIAAHLYNLAAQLLGGFQVTYTSQD